MDTFLLVAVFIVVALALIIVTFACVAYLRVVTRLNFMEGQFEIMRTVPVLRQYVKEYVPVEITPEREKEIMQKMQEQANEWEKMYGFAVDTAAPFVNRVKEPRIDDVKEEDLV